MMDEHLVETMVSSRQVFRGKLLDTWQDDVRMPDGTPAVREYIKHPGASVMVPLTDDQQVIMLKQFRYAVSKVMIELPAGKLDAGETSEETAYRELEEEVGYSSAQLQLLGTIHPCIGYSDEFIDIYLALDLTETQTTDHPDELLEVIKVPFADAIMWIDQGQITDAKTIVALYWAERALANQL